MIPDFVVVSSVSLVSLVSLVFLVSLVPFSPFVCFTLRLELAKHKPAWEVATDIVTHDCPEPCPEHHNLRLAH